MTRASLLLSFLSILSCFFITDVSGLDSEAIIGGDFAEDEQFKHQVSLQVNGAHICGGAILADDYILTAAHCVTEKGEFKPYPYNVAVGITNLNSNPNGKLIEADVDKVYIHKQYSPITYQNDIAVLKLNKKLGLGRKSYLEKINLPEDDNTYAGKVATISGFGASRIQTAIHPLTGETVELNHHVDGKLRFAKVKIIDHEQCKRDVTYVPKIFPSHICGYQVQRGRKPEGICNGDSGGPLIYGKTVIGIVSISPPGCNENKEPAAYTRVSSYSSFIRNILNGHPTNAEVHQKRPSANSESSEHPQYPAYPQSPEYPGYPFPEQEQYPEYSEYEEYPSFSGQLPFFGFPGFSDFFSSYKKS